MFLEYDKAYGANKLRLGFLIPSYLNNFDTAFIYYVKKIENKNCKQVALLII